MFRLYLMDANKDTVRTLKNWAGINTAGQGAMSIGILAGRITEILPKEKILDSFTYMALAIAIVGVITLFVFPKVISVSFAELGIATSLIYLGYSLTGFFQPPYNLVITAILIIMALVFVILFISGLKELWRLGGKSDFTFGVIILIIFFGIWLFPI